MTPSGIEIFSNFSIILLKDKKMVQKINELIKDINRNGLSNLLFITFLFSDILLHCRLKRYLL